MSSLNLITKSALMSPGRVVEPLWWVGHIPFVMWLVENTKPQTLVELGTHTGNSYFAMCHSVKSNRLPTRCYAVDTWQGDLHQGAYDDDVYRSVKHHNDSNFSEFSDLLRMTFDEALSKFGEGTVDLLHIDGLHTYEAARHDFETWLPKLSDRAVVLFHDTTVRKLDFGVWRLWEELSVKYPNVHFDYSQGLGVLFVGERQPFVIHDLLNSWAAPEEKSIVHQLFARLGQSVEFECATANLNQAIADHDVQIANLIQGVAERDGQIDNLQHQENELQALSNLNQAIADHDVQIAKLIQGVAEHDGQIDNLQRQKNELQALSNELRNEIASIRLSTSWRITKPLRAVSQWRQRFMRLVRIYQKYRQIYPGFSGSVRMSYRCIDIVRKRGIKGLRNTIYLYEHRHNRTAALTQYFPSMHKVLTLEDVVEPGVALPSDVAVHLHVYYSDIVPDIRAYLENIPVNFHLYVTTDTPEKAKLIELEFSTLKSIKVLDINIVENRGRDIFPMLVTLGEKLAKHELVLHIHTKRSPHNLWELAGWRRYLMESLLGNSRRVTAIFQQFVQDKDLGILFPDYYHPIKPLVYKPDDTLNDKSMKILLVRAGRKKNDIDNIDRTFYPAGNMFWFRGKAMEPFLNMNLAAKDFESEQGQLNGTFAHAIERMFPYFASQMGMHSKPYLANSFLSQECSAHKFDLFRTFLARGLIVKPTIIFDHNGGGGSNIYTAELVKVVHADGGAALRVYCFDAVWFVQWIGGVDGMLFYTFSIQELFEVLSISHSTNIILNSMYGYPDIKVAVSKIIDLVQALSATLDVKIHDFYALCPSPHLSDFEEKYCGVPKDLGVCGQCLKKNLGWYHSWYPKNNMPVDMAEWRKPFAELFEAATTVVFFDQSSVEILLKVFNLEDRKIKIAPHIIDYFKCDKPIGVTGSLHIGILGTLSHIKGGNVVKALYEHIHEQGLRIPITVVGPSLVDMPEKINVYGNYEKNELPLIVSEHGINVILMPSIVPETFSYTISEAMKMGLPIVAFDIGAQGNRVRQYALGKVVPLGSSSEVVLSAIQSALKAAQEFKK